MCWLLRAAYLPIIVVGVLTNNHHFDVLKSTAVEGPAHQDTPLTALCLKASYMEQHATAACPNTPWPSGGPQRKPAELHRLNYHGHTIEL